MGGCCFCGNWKRITGLAGAWLAERFAAWLASWLDAFLSGWVHACLLASLPACPPGSLPTLSACVCACLPACLSDCLPACLPACLTMMMMIMMMMMMGGVGGVHEDAGDGEVFWKLFLKTVFEGRRLRRSLYSEARARVGGQAGLGPLLRNNLQINLGWAARLLTKVACWGCGAWPHPGQMPRTESPACCPARGRHLARCPARCPASGWAGRARPAAPQQPSNQSGLG